MLDAEVCQDVADRDPKVFVDAAANVVVSDTLMMVAEQYGLYIPFNHQVKKLQPPIFQEAAH